MRDTIDMAREAGWPIEAGNNLPDTGSMNLKAFEALVRADERSVEREACANLRKEVELQGIRTSDYEDGFWDALAKYEDMIRARGTHDN